MHRPTMTRIALAALLVAGLGVATRDAFAFRMIQNTTVGRVSAGSAVPCSHSGGFTHWTNANIPWWHNTGGQGAGKATAIQNGLTSWNNVSPATHNLSYAGTTTAGFVTDSRNTVLWARGNGCNGNCLAITALVLASGQVITETDVSFNSRFTWNTNGSNYDTEAVWAHEAGHGLGIHHTEITGTPRPTMYASYFGTDGRSLEQDDKDALNCAYNRYPFPTQQFASRPAVAEGGAAAGVALASSQRTGVAVLRFSLPAEGEVSLDLYDVAGRHLVTLMSGARGAGEHEVAWDGATRFGASAPGVYFARLVTPYTTARATVLLVD